MYQKAIFLFLLFVSLGHNAWAQSYAGTYIAQTAEQTVTLTLQQTANGQLQGTLQTLEGRFPLTAQVAASGIRGRLNIPGENYGFVAAKQQSQLHLTLFELFDNGYPDYSEAENLVFNLQGATAATGQPATGQVRPPPYPGGDRRNVAASAVIINRTPLSNARLQALASQYATKLPGGSYWYDRMSGAWGMEGGPTLGFTVAGLDLPGPMPRDISGGGTGIVINGREIHPQDQMALAQMLGMTLPGHYWLDARGNLGVQGGGVIVNLVQAGQRGGSTGGGSGLVSGAGGTVGTDGSGGVLFFQRNSSGGYNSYSN